MWLANSQKCEKNNQFPGPETQTNDNANNLLCVCLVCTNK